MSIGIEDMLVVASELSQCYKRHSKRSCFVDCRGIFVVATWRKIFLVVDDMA
jgi:hypothetical protein